MNHSSDPRLVQRLSFFASASAIFSAGVGISGLAGWALHLRGPTTWGIAPVKMVANTAACLLLLSVSLWVLRKQEPGRLTRTRELFAHVLATIAAGVGLLSLTEHVFRLDLGIDQLLVAVPAAEVAPGLRPGLMSSVTGLALLLLGAALWLLNWRTKRDDWPAQFLALGALIAAAFGFFALAFEPVRSPISMAWPTAVSLSALACGVLCARSNWALGGLLVSQTPGARLARKGVPVALLVLSLIGWSISKPLLTDNHFTWVQVSVLAVFCSTLLAGFVAWVAFMVDRIDAERKKAEAALDLEQERLDLLLDRAPVPQSEKALRRRAKAGFAAAILLMQAIGFLSWRNAQQASEDADWVAHTNQVSAALERTLRHLDDVETGVRGFGLTGVETFLGPYESGRNAVAQDLQALRLLMADNPDQERRLDTLAEEANARVAAARGLVALRRALGIVPNEAHLERGRDLMDAARATVAEMEATEDRLLIQRTERSRFSRRFTSGAIGVGSVLGAILLSFAGFTVSREIGISSSARAQVIALNAQLEQRVADRTAALNESEGRLAGIIHSAMDSIITVDGQQQIILFNSAAERIFRCPAADALGQPISRFIPARFHAAHEQHVRKFAQNGVTTRTMGPTDVLWAVRADGQEFQIEASISKIVIRNKALLTVILRDVTERVQIAETRDRLAAIVDSSDDAIISKDLNGTITAWNHGAEKVFGYSASETVGKPMLMLFPPELVSEEADILARIGRGESVEHYETVRVRKDGTKIDVSVTISPIRDSSGAIIGASKVARDITERKRAEAALRESEERFRTLIEQASDAFFLHDSEGRFLEVNRQACESLGYTREELLRMSVLDVEQGIDIREVHRAWEQVEPGKAYTIHGRQRRKDGTTFPVEVRLSAYYIDGRKLHLGLARDVTERMLAEEALRDKEHLVSESQRIAHLGSWTYDPSDASGRIVWSEEMYRVYGVSPDSFTPTVESFFELVFPEDRAAMRKWIAECAAGERPEDLDYRVVMPDGAIRFFSGRGELQLDAEGRPVRMAGSAQDITERKNTAEALRQSEEHLRLALDGAQLGTWHWNLETGELVSPDSMALLGLPPSAKMTYEIFRGALHPDDRAPTDEAVRRSLDEHTAYDTEYRAVWPDGSQHWIAAKGHGYYDAAGKAVRMEGVVMDVTERREAQERLRVSEENYRMLFDSMDQGFCTIEVLFDGDENPVDYRFLEVNPAFEKQTGIAHAQGRRMREIAPLHEAHWFQIYGQVALTGEPIRLENEAAQLHGWYDVHAFRVGEPNERKVAILFNDISERKRSEKALRESETNFRGLANLAPQFAWICTNDGLNVYFNDRWFKYTGLTPEQSYGTGWNTPFHPDDKQSAWDAWNRATATGETYRVESRLRAADGSYRWFLVLGEPLRDDDGGIIKWFGTCTDIHDMKLTRDALHDSEEKLRLALEGARLGTWNWDLKTGELVGSPLAFAMFGLPADTKFDFPIFLSTLHLDDRTLVNEAMQRTLAGDGEYDVEYRCIWPDGTERWIAAKGRLYRNEAGENIRVGGIVFDVTDRRTAEAALRESEQRFQAMANGIPQLAWMAEADGHIFWYNQRWYEYTGTRPEQMEGWGWKSVHDPGMLPKVLERWQHSIASGEPFDMEFPLRGADGTFRMFLTRVMPVKDAEGHVVRWFGTNTDISERQEAENRLAMQAEELSHQATELARSREALEKQTLMLKMVLESMAEGLVAADREGHFLLWNDAARRLMGQGASNLPAEQWSAHYQMFLPDGLTPYPTDQLPLVRAMNGESVAVEMIIRLSEGDSAGEPGTFLEVTGRPMKDTAGNLRGGLVAFRDITERKRADAALAWQAEELSRQAQDLLASRQALEAQRLMLRSVLDSMSEGLVATDEKGKFILWNPAAKKIVGLGPSDLDPTEWNAHYGVYLPDRITPLPVEQNPTLRALRGETCTAELFIHNPKLAEGIWIELSANPLKDAEGKVRGGVSAFRDITRRKMDEAEIRKLNEELEERVEIRTAELAAANKELEAFTYSVSHDLRAPLRHMSGFTRILVEDFGPSLPEEAQQHLQRIESGAKRMGQLVDELLNLTRVGRQALAVQRTSLGPIIKDVIAMLEPETEGRQIEWKITEMPFVECDPTLIRQVFQNLIGNALKYSRPRSPAVIEIGQIQQNESSVIFVRDNGVGFSMKYADKLFGVFQRLHRHEEFEGTGVGLATVQRIIQKHGGRVWAEAEPDRGATFYFTLAGREHSSSESAAAAAGA